MSAQAQSLPLQPSRGVGSKLRLILITALLIVAAAIGSFLVARATAPASTTKTVPVTVPAEVPRPHPGHRHVLPVSVPRPGSIPGQGQCERSGQETRC